MMIYEKSKQDNPLKKRIYTWVVELISFIKSLKKEMVNDIVARQILRSGSSVGANYIESQAASSRKDFINFLHHSLKSANETKYWLALVRDACDGDKIKTEYLLKEITEIANILGASIRTAKQNEHESKK